ncbi:MAG TPA: GGDEF domain-containing protein [Gemmatimonadales bacterium]|nr:GGDEF domain-containing protein [Gemmatimonadales bacterium]
MAQSQGPSWWPLAHAREAGHSAGMRRVVAVWLVLSLVAVGLALLEATYDWSGIPFQLGPVTVSVTFYPPVFVTLLLTLWLGPTWGAVPAYFAILASALHAGMPWRVAALFACASPVELVIVWGSMVILDIHPDLERRQDLWRFLAVAAVAALASSLAGLIWIDTMGLDLLAGERIWQGWVVGDFLQIGILLPPFLRWLGPPVRGWVDRQFAAPPRRQFSYTRSVLLVVALVFLMMVLVFQGVAMITRSLQIPPTALTPSGEPLLPRLREILWFMALLVLVAIVTTTAFASVLARSGERERTVSQRDALTGALNRRAFYRLFEKEQDRSFRVGRGLSLVFFDVDRFKALNDTWGHETGDEVLRQLVRRVASVVREHDLLFRWGGEEFVILLPHTDPADAPALAERVREAVAAEPLLREYVADPITITVSLGTAGTLDRQTLPDTLVARADAACYRAKQRGRNRVEEEGAGVGV